MLVLCGRLRVRPLHVSRSTAIPDVSPQVGSDRPTCMRLHYPLLLRATRPPDTDRAIRTLLGNLESTQVSPSGTPHAFRDCLADYNPLGQFGSAATTPSR
jgi:hypothetical protein